jgi:methyl-accepting chemotaxis protein
MVLLVMAVSLTSLYPDHRAAQLAAHLATQVAKGDLCGQIEVEVKGETGKLLASCRTCSRGCATCARYAMGPRSSVVRPATSLMAH